MNTPIAVLLSRKGSSVFAVAALATVADAVHAMNLHKVGSVIVTQGDQLVGIFTERDVLTRVVAAGRSPEMTSVADVMTHNPVTATPHDTIEDVMRVITERRCRHLPVIDPATGSVQGVISIGDVMSWMVDSHRAEADQLRTYVQGVYVT
ncbi:MAG TPA: CBS domain-containing protein [Opitutaceae bacterium]|nr:CBS domain-containing protein [Opitutaceae bacterium]